MVAILIYANTTHLLNIKANYSPTSITCQRRQWSIPCRMSLTCQNYPEEARSYFDPISLKRYRYFDSLIIISEQFTTRSLKQNDICEIADRPN